MTTEESVYKRSSNLCPVVWAGLITNPTFTQFHVILYAMSTSPPSQMTQDSLFPAAGHHSCGRALELGEIYICVDSSNFHSRA